MRAPSGPALSSASLYPGQNAGCRPSSHAPPHPPSPLPRAPCITRMRRRPSPERGRDAAAPSLAGLIAAVRALLEAVRKVAAVQGGLQKEIDTLYSVTRPAGEPMLRFCEGLNAFSAVVAGNTRDYRRCVRGLPVRLKHRAQVWFCAIRRWLSPYRMQRGYALRASIR